jgi:hypothetical protein
MYSDRKKRVTLPLIIVNANTHEIINAMEFTMLKMRIVTRTQSRLNLAILSRQRRE